MQRNFSRWLIIGGTTLVIAVLFFALWLYWPVLEAEVQYRFVWSQQAVPSVVGLTTGTHDAASDTVPELVPVNQTFSITIPKLWTSAPVIANVNTQDSRIYQRALQQGVAHAAGSSLPNDPGTTFLFAHSSANQLVAQRYNAVFYLLNKLAKDDDILVYYGGTPYHYKVTKTQVVQPDKVAAMQSKSGPQQLVLMTCTPAGTTLKRLLVYADLVPTAPLPESEPMVN